MRVKTVWVSWLLNACQETGLMQQTKLICRQCSNGKIIIDCSRMPKRCCISQAKRLPR